MANAPQDHLESANDMVPLSDGGGPFQEFDDVPGKTSKQSGTLTPDSNLTRNRRISGGVSRDNLAGR
jgi:hypothetical protein